MGIFNYDKIKHLVNEQYKIAIEMEHLLELAQNFYQNTLNKFTR